MFLDLAAKHFSFLTDELGFHLVRHDRWEEWAQRVILESANARAKVVLDRGFIYAAVGPKDGGNVWFDASEVMLIDNPLHGFRRDFDVAAYERDPETVVDRQLALEADLLRTHCEDMLLGDFSRRPLIEEALRKWKREA